MRRGTGPAARGAKRRKAEARIRLAHQIPDAEKAARADYVIENTGDLAALKARVMEAVGATEGGEQQIRKKLSLE